MNEEIRLLRETITRHQQKLRTLDNGNLVRRSMQYCILQLRDRVRELEESR